MSEAVVNLRNTVSLLPKANPNLSLHRSDGGQVDVQKCDRDKALQADTIDHAASPRLRKAVAP